MPGTATISGVISGLDTTSIISKMMDLAKKPVTLLQDQKTALDTKLKAWQDLNTRVLALKTNATTLANPTTFDTKSVTSSDSDVLTGAATSSAQAGTYYIKVSNIATSQQLKTAGYADINTAAVGTGTFSIKVGSGDAKTITIDSNNNTLSGLRDAINRSGAGVTASIISDGSATNPYRLVIASNTSGTDGQITISDNTLSGGSIPFATTELQPAANASVTIGSGSTPLTVSSSSNKLTSVIPGLTINLLSDSAGKTITVTVANDTSAVKKSITDLVTQYNNLVDFIKTQNAFDASTQTGGPLLGDFNLRQITDDLNSKLFNPVGGPAQTTKMLSQIGVTIDIDGKLYVDDKNLDNALANNMDGVKSLLAAVGTTNNGNVTYLSGTDATRNSGDAGYAVSITTAATQARITAGVAQTAPLGADETLTFNKDSKTNKVDVALKAGMTQSQVISEINKHSAETGILASSLDDGLGNGTRLTLKRIAYGSSSEINVVSSVSNGGSNPVANTTGIGTKLITLFSPKNTYNLDGTVKSTTYSDSTGEDGNGSGVLGVNVAGTINGEAATGVGQVLSGNTKTKTTPGNPNTAGLRLLITASTPGNYGTVVYTKGIGSLLSDYSTNISDYSNGAINSAENGIRDQMSRIDDSITKLNTQLAEQETRLQNQFAAMENAMSQLQQQGNQIASMFSSSSSK